MKRILSLRNVKFVNIVSNRNFESATSHTNILNIRHHTKKRLDRTRFEKDFCILLFPMPPAPGTGTRKVTEFSQLCPNIPNLQLPVAAPTFWRKMSFNLRAGGPGQLRLVRSEGW